MINRITNVDENNRTNIYLVRPGSTPEEEIEGRLRDVGDIVSFSLYKSDQHAPF